MDIEKLQRLINYRNQLEVKITSWKDLIESIDDVKEMFLEYPGKHVHISKDASCSYNGITDGVIMESMKRTFVLELKGKISEYIGKYNRIDKIIKDAEAALMTVEDPDDEAKAG